ncbi:MAG: InlB B-repeat-containing protein [Bacilli bacterium]|nr:InlB B-repeat-containing protein [Bacilli bacterium]
MKVIKKLFVLLLFSVSSLLFIQGIYGYFMKITNPHVNEFSILQSGSYTVRHLTMDLDGINYSLYQEDNFTASIGATVTPSVLDITGFYSPQTQTITVDSSNSQVITYQYVRRQYTLTITDSNYVTTTTPSGTYYYGTEIHLVADATDGNGNPFVKWSNNETNPDYTFQLTENTTIKPLYAETYIITYVPNNGSSSFTEEVIQTEPINTFPDVEYNDCSGGTGTYEQQGCTYVYKLLGWYKDSNFTNKVDESFVPTEDTTLYAKWNKLYYGHPGQVEFTGNNFINTYVELFNEENARKDFIVTFKVDEYTGFNNTNNQDHRGTIFSNMDESGSPYYGVHFYHDTEYVVNINASANKNDRMKDNTTGYVTGKKVVFKRENGIVYYSYDDGPFVQTKDFSSFTAYFDDPATFGGGFKPNDPRYLIGKLSNMSVEIIEPETYTIHFDANGGTGVIPDQVIELGDTPNITSNRFTNGDSTFGGWNTEPDGTGTSYTNNYAITSDLANAGETITLYAQWIPTEHYYVHFDANGGTGTMTNQQFVIGASAEPLTSNEFTRTGYEFRGWNTAADGTGTHYDDEEAVSGLSNVVDDVVTLYAEWWKIEFIRTGDVVFDGTANTFINTGVNIFSPENINKDFEIRFTFKSIDNDQMQYITGNPKQPTIFNAKDESNSKYPGMNVRFSGNITTINPTYRWGGSTTTVGNIAVSNKPIEFIYRRKSNNNNEKIITIEYKYNNYDSGEITTINQSSWSLNQPFATNVAFGGYFDGSNQPGRFFKGTLADISIIMEE